MKKLTKGIILTTVIAAAVSSGLLTNSTTQIDKKVEKEKIQAYNSKPANILDNVFIQNNNRILPFILNNTNETITVDKVKSEFSKKGLTVKSISPIGKNINGQDVVGTGTKITVNQNSYTYNVVVYGDVTGEGTVDLVDAYNIILHGLDRKKLTGFNSISGNVNLAISDLDLIDAYRVILFSLGQKLSPTSLVVNPPASLKETDKTAPVITLTGANPQYIKCKKSYTQLGATAKDDIDGNVAVTYSYSNVNVNTPGTYKVTYTAVDGQGNKATKTRDVVVQDYVTGIQLVSKPTKLAYKYGEALNLAGGSIKVVYASGKTETKQMSASDVKVTGYTSTLGTKTLTVSYTTSNTENDQSKTFTIPSFTVTVSDYVTEVQIVNKPTKTAYQYNEELNLAGGSIKVTYASGKTETKNMSDASAVSVTGYNKTNVGTGTSTQTLTAKHIASGKTVTFTVTVSDYVKEITITKPTNTTYKYGETLDLTGGKVQVVNASGKNNPAAIDMNNTSAIEVTGYNATDVGTGTKTQTLTVKHKPTGKTKTFTVTVSDYIKSIQIVDNETEKAYKYGEALRGKVQLTYASSATKIEVVDINNTSVLEVKGYDKNNITGKQTVTVTHKATKLSVTLEVTVSNYIKGIKIETAPTKTYMQDDTLDIQTLITDGLKVMKIWANGTEEEIKGEDINNIEVTPEKATVDNQKIKVVYTTDNKGPETPEELSDEHSIVVRKPVSTITATATKNEGTNTLPQYYYDTFKIEVFSGTNELPIDESKIKTEITEGSSTTPVDAAIAHIDGDLNFIATKANTTYKVKLIYDNNANISTDVTITVEEKMKVNHVTVGNVTNVSIGNPIIVPIEFAYYHNNSEVKKLDIAANELIVDTNQKANITFYKDENESPAEGTNLVKYIKIEPKAVGEITLTFNIKGNECEAPSSKIKAQGKQLVIEPPTNIGLSISNPIYVKMYYIDDTGKKTQINIKDIIDPLGDNTDENQLGIIGIKDSVNIEGGFNIPNIYLKAYTEDEHGNKTLVDETANSDISIAGIAITVYDDGADYSLGELQNAENPYISITYYGVEIENLKITSVTK